MSDSFCKQNILTAVSLLLILALFVTAWLFPSTGTMLGMIFLLFGLVTSFYMTIKRHRGAYLQGKISLVLAVRNIMLEVSGILLAMVLAGVLGRNAAEFAIGQMGQGLARIISGIVIGLLVGVLVGLLIKRATVHLVKT